MISLFLGPDDFTKKQTLIELAQKAKAELVFFDVENSPEIQILNTQDLFAKDKVFGLKGLIGKFNSPDAIEKLLAGKNQIVFLEEKLDKRQTANKELLANKSIKVEEFLLPHGQELNKWIVNHAKSLGISIASSAVESLAVALGRDDAKETKVGGKVIASEEIFTLWQADSEIKKLAALAQGREISEIDVKALATENKEVDVFDLTNAIAENQKTKAMDLMHKFLQAQAGSEEKAAVIQLNALLSEQFRNVAAVQDFIVNKKTEDEILEKTGWKSGRLFVMKKVAGKFPSKKIMETLQKLSALDEELKTSQTPPRVLLDLIMSQLFV